MGKVLQIGLPLVVGVVLCCAVGLWVYPLVGADAQGRYPAFVQQFYDTDVEAGELRLPDKEAETDIKVTPVDFPGEFVKGEGKPASDIDGAWPVFRGEYYNNINDSDVKLIRDFSAGKPAELWSLDLGEGYAGAAVRDGRVYVLDYDTKAGRDVLLCVSLADGKEIWRRSYASKVKPQHGVSRTIPAVTEDYVITLGPRCVVMCCEAATGKFLWGKDLVVDYGTKVPQWYAGQCPIIDQGRAIIAPGGKSLMVAYDCKTGKVVWETPNPAGWQMTHGSILPVSFAGKSIYIYCATGGVVGVDADTGKTLFTYAGWQIKLANVPTPVDLGGGKLLLSGGYGAGAMFAKLVEKGDKIEFVPGKRMTDREFGAYQQTPIFYKGFIFGVLPKKGEFAGQLACMDLTGSRSWTSGPSNRFDWGPFMVADGMILAMNDSGVLSLIEADSAEFKLLGKTKVLSGHESWAPMALVDGRLIVRDFKRMICLDMRVKKKEADDE